MSTLRQVTNISAKEATIATHTVVQFKDDVSICSIPIKFIMATSFPETNQNYYIKWTDKKLYSGQVLSLGKQLHIEITVYAYLLIIIVLICYMYYMCCGMRKGVKCR